MREITGESLAADVLRAAARIRPHVRETPVEVSPWLGGHGASEHGGGTVFLKLENFQLTGSFKIRGAFHKLLCLPEAVRRRGVVAASSGNHGIAVAHAAGELGVKADLYVPEDASAGKLERIRSLGGTVHRLGEDCLVAELAARRVAGETGRAYLSPYNDPDVIAGQGTVGVELARQLPGLDAVFVALGGGGLAAGIAAHLKSLDPEVEIIACSPERSCVLHRSIEAGEILDLPSLPTLSDGTAGGVEPGAITFDLCRGLVDRTVLVSEEEIAAAMLGVIGHHHTLIEGAAGVAVAGYGKLREDYAGRRVAIVLCGANLSLEVLRTLLHADGAATRQLPPGG